MIKRTKKTEPTAVTLDVYDTSGVVISKKELPGDIFNVPLSEGVVHFAATVQRANARAGTSSTKTRGEVRGGGKKPWKQKGTGRARHGSIRSPLWRGGGITFGPRTDRNWSLHINRKVKKKALCMVLSDKVREQKMILLDALVLSAPKTKEAVRLLSRLPLATPRARVGVVLPSHSSELSRSMRNIPNVQVLSVHSLNILDLLKCRTVVLPAKSIDELIHVLGEKK